MVELLQILLVNASRHAPGAATRIEATREGSMIRVSVTDSGPGVPEQLRDVIFERGAHREDSEGQGLGLSIARRLAHGLGGTLELVTDVPGRRTLRPDAAPGRPGRRGMTAAYRVTVVDDHSLFAETLVIALRTEGFQASPWSRATTCHPAKLVRSIEQTHPHLVLLDLDLGVGRDGTSLVPAPGGSGSHGGGRHRRRWQRRVRGRRSRRARRR